MLQELDDFLDSFQPNEVKMGLERTRYILEAMGSPQQGYRTIHVGGTNGKGSTCMFIASILKEAGYRVGLYTSPHVQDFRERITVDFEPIGEDSLAEVIGRVRPIVEGMEGDMRPTYFEVITALAFDHFSEAGVDYAVIEVGLGGAMDATNVIVPEAAVITNISRDHTTMLGSSLEGIAREKAGIIKPGVPVYTAECKEAPLGVIEGRCREAGCRLVNAFGTWSSRESLGLEGQRFELRGSRGTYSLRTPLLGAHQMENAALAVMVAEDLAVDGRAIERGVSSTPPLPGRMEVARRRPLVILDGAHNPGAMDALGDTIREVHPGGKRLLVIGILKDKAIDEMAGILSPLFDEFYITRPKSDRAAGPEVIQRALGKGVVVEDVGDAVGQALDRAGPGDVVCVTGSFYTVAEAREAMA
ncbi:MAG: bifunctional folylpolyglutamate synthase/dihydrofolate synthase [Euryarchaeota archaeon]|nr:bifunctional folylpolyglutamate synthase/dihydrofolate synthase [Euryarchaeota archaeon]